MLPSLRQLEAFVTLAQVGVFARASELLGMSQPALSQAISQLELRLELRLFDRTTRSVRLTPDGFRLLQDAERILNDLKTTLTQLTREASAREPFLNIGMVPSLAFRFFPKVLQDFARHQPRVRVLVRDAHAQALCEAVTNGELDASLSTRPTGWSNLEFRALFKDAFYLVVPRDHPCAGRGPIGWQEIVGFDFIGYTSGNSNRNLIDEKLGRLGLQLRPALEVTQLATILGLVDAGMGIAALPALACPVGNYPNLCVRPLVEPVLTRELGLVTAKDKLQRPELTALQACIEARGATSDLLDVISLKRGSRRSKQTSVDS